MDTTGFFALREPLDLLEKLRYDYRRLEREPTDSYAAFDFFVTASHMHEWLQRSGVSWEKPTAPHTLAAYQAAYHLCGEIGNGAKHFVMEHKELEGHEVRAGVFDPVVFDPRVFDVGSLVLHLNAADAAVFGMESITALQLAVTVLSYWDTCTALR